MHAYDHTGWELGDSLECVLVDWSPVLCGTSMQAWSGRGTMHIRTFHHWKLSTCVISPPSLNLIAVYPLKWSWSSWLGPLPLLLLVSTDTIYNSLAPSEAWLAQDGQDIDSHCEFDLGFNKGRNKFTLWTILTCGYPYWVRRVAYLPTARANLAMQL